MSDEKYAWTNHARQKMRFYRLSEVRVKRIIRHPARVEEGIIEGGVACMQPAGGKRYSEIWTMYVLVKDVASRQLPSETRKNVCFFSKPQGNFNARTYYTRLAKFPAEACSFGPARNFSPRSVALFSAYGRKTMPARPHEGLLGELPRPHHSLKRGAKRIKIITAWRYPGKSPARNPIPPEVLREIKNIL